MKHPKNLETPWSEYFVEELEFGEQYSLWGKLARIPKVIYSFEARRKLARLLDRVTPDVCHAHNIYHHISPSILGLLKGRGIPTVLTLPRPQDCLPGVQHARARRYLRALPRRTTAQCRSCIAASRARLRLAPS